MAQLLLIRGARQLLTLRGSHGVRRGEALHDLALIEDGSVLIRDGLVASVGSTRRLENLKEARGAPEIDVSGALVMPGFVDPGLQLTFGAAQQPVESGGRGKKRMSDFYNESLLLFRSCLQHGTLNAQVKATSGTMNTRSDVSLLRQLTHIGDYPIGLVRTWRIGRQMGFQPHLAGEYSSALSLLARRKFAHGVEVTAESQGFITERLQELPVAPRLAVTLLWHPRAGRDLGEMLGLMRPQSICCPVELPPAECQAAAESGLPVVVSPGQDILAEQPRSSMRALAASGAALALSSGYHSQDAPTFNMQMTIALAVGRLGLTIEQAIVAATVNAAHALGLGRSTGSIEVGKKADLLVMNLPDYRELPRRFGTNHVGMVIRDGKVALNRTGWKVSA